MLHAFLNRDPWFRQRRYGLGAGLPIVWQGWALVAAYLGVVAGIGLATNFGSAKVPTGSIIALLVATGIFVTVAQNHTEGGWRWHWGDE
ncbi:MAG: hypothetical protein RLZZ58_1428 [Pseudomonadota bacterium]